jgi:hypothetical protein
MLTPRPVLNLVIIQEEPVDDYHSPQPSLTHNNFHRSEAGFPPSEPLTASISDMLRESRDRYLVVVLGFQVSSRQNSG